MLAIDPGKPVACVPAPRWRSLPSPDSARSSGRHTAADRTEVDLAVGTGDAELVAAEVGVPANVDDNEQLVFVFDEHRGGVFDVEFVDDVGAHVSGSDRAAE